MQHYLKADLKKVKPVDGKMTSTDLHFTTKREIVASEGSTRKPHQYVARHTFNPKMPLREGNKQGIVSQCQLSKRSKLILTYHYTVP